MCTNVEKRGENLKNLPSIDVVVNESESETPLLEATTTQILVRKRHRRGKPNRRKLKLNLESNEFSTNSGLQSQLLPNSGNYSNSAHAPYNTNQFLIEDHGETDDLDVKLSELTKTQDSSFSYDSDNEMVSMSADEENDDEDMLEQDFTNDYNTMHYEQLNNMTKSDLLDKYIQLEKKYDLCVQRLRNNSVLQGETVPIDVDDDTDVPEEHVPNDDHPVAETSASNGNVNVNKNVEFYKNQVKRLRIENGKLKRKQNKLARYIHYHFKNVKCNGKSNI